MSTFYANINKLDPKNFKGSFETYFNFNNHVKIIATNNLAYWGSANYSVESQNNFEAGTVTKDRDFINYLFNNIFEELKEESIPYYEDDYNELRLTIMRLSSLLTKHKEFFDESLLTSYDHFEGLAFTYEETDYSEEDFYELEYLVDEWTSIRALIENIENESTAIQNCLEDLFNIYDSLEIPNLKSLIYDSSFHEYTCANLESLYDSCFQKYSLEAYDENLNFYVEKAYDEAREEIESMTEGLGETIVNSFYELEKLEGVIQKLVYGIERLSDIKVNLNINNTL